MSRRHLPGVELPGRHHVVGVVRVGDGLFIALKLAADGGKVLPGIGLRQGEPLAAGGHQRLVGHAVVNLHQRRGVVDGGHGGDVLQLGVVHEAEGHQGHRRHQCAHQNKGRPPPHFAAAAVRYGAEQGQHKQGQHVVQRHDHAGPALLHAELVGEDQGNGVVVGLPEGADQEKGEAHQYGAFVVEFHTFSPPKSRYTAAISL